MEAAERESVKQIEVLPVAWAEFGDEFTRWHQGWLVSLERVETRELEPFSRDLEHRWHTLEAMQPLRRVAFDSPHKGSQAAIIETGPDADAAAHRVEDVLRVYRLRVDSGHQGLRIDTADGMTLLVWFRVPAVPEATDGLAPREI